MIGYIVISFIIWIALWYVWFHYRYTDTRSIDGMRESLRKSKESLETISLTERELTVQNKLLKKKTEQLLIQNEDYSKMISKLSRYYFHIKEANNKIDELKKILQMFDDDLENQLTDAHTELPINSDLPVDMTPLSGQKGKFF